MLRGIDVSSAQGVVPWAEAKAAMGLAFCYAKAGNGNAGADPTFARNVAGARAAGLKVGAYNVVFPLPTDGAHPGRSPQDQAHAHFLASGGLGSRPGELAPALDAEWPAPEHFAEWGCSPAQIRAWLIDYLEAATELWGRKPLVYVYPDWAAKVGMGREPRFASYGLWMASYTHPDRWPVDGEAPFVPAPWDGAWTLWQASGGTQALPNGVPVDLDVLNGGDAELAALCGESAPSGISPILVDNASQPTPPGDLPPVVA